VTADVQAMRWNGTAAGASPIIGWLLDNNVTARYVCSDPARCSEFNGDCPHWIHVDTPEGVAVVSLGDEVVQTDAGFEVRKQAVS